MKRLSTKKHEFKVIIQRDEDGYFVASVPALPGCHTQAKTLPELMKRVKEVIMLCLDVARENPGYRKQIQSFAHEPSFIAMDIVRV